MLIIPTWKLLSVNNTEDFIVCELIKYVNKLLNKQQPKSDVSLHLQDSGTNKVAQTVMNT